MSYYETTEYILKSQACLNMAYLHAWQFFCIEVSHDDLATASSAPIY